MIGYLKGSVVGVQKTSRMRVVLLLEVNHIGFEIQILPRMMPTLPDIGQTTQIFTHLQGREDQWVLFGFNAAAERDLFRQLVSVSGIGPQLAIALLDTLEFVDLVQAIVSGNTRLLARTPGVGPKTAERIALELKSKLAEWRQQMDFISTPTAAPTSSIQEEVEMTLLALGYTQREIIQALQTIGQTTSLSKSADVEIWIREAIAWLSQ